MSYARNLVYAPSLEELIKACNCPVFTFTKKSDWHKYEIGASWVAGGSNEIPKELTITEMERVYREGLGDTPDEAVARLWLELNRFEPSTPEEEARGITKVPGFIVHSSDTDLTK